MIYYPIFISAGFLYFLWDRANKMKHPSRVRYNRNYFPNRNLTDHLTMLIKTEILKRYPFATHLEFTNFKAKGKHVSMEAYVITPAQHWNATQKKIMIHGDFDTNGEFSIDKIVPTHSIDSNAVVPEISDQCLNPFARRRDPDWIAKRWPTYSRDWDVKWADKVIMRNWR